MTESGVDVKNDCSGYYAGDTPRHMRRDPLKVKPSGLVVPEDTFQVDRCPRQLLHRTNRNGAAFLPLPGSSRIPLDNNDAFFLK